MRVLEMVALAAVVAACGAAQNRGEEADRGRVAADDGPIACERRLLCNAPDCSCSEGYECRAECDDCRADCVPVAPAALSFTEADDGSSATVPPGGTFTLALAENITTGYSWTLELSPGLTIVSDGSARSPGTEGMAGAGGTHTWTIEATTAGTHAIAGHYRRPWENPPVDARSFSMTVRVP